MTRYALEFAAGRQRRGRACRLLLAALLLPLPALAWNGAGHRLVACLAWERLGEAQREQLAQLLREHPDHALWLRRAGDAAADDGRAAFIEASTWPDDIRSDGRFFSAGVDAPTPTLPGFPDMERRRDWHGVSYPLRRADDPAAGPATPGAAVSGRLDQALATLIRRYALPSATRDERRYARPWLIHLVADAHQPLHTSVRVDAHGEVDARGVTVRNRFNPRKPSSSLHAYWDDLPGPPWLRGDRLDAACRALAAIDTPAAPTTSAQWLAESWQIARQSGYPPSDDEVPTISAEFNENSRQIARQRIAQAGRRLAELLRELLEKTKD